MKVKSPPSNLMQTETLYFQESSSIETRIMSLKRDLENLVYENVCRSLFKEDRLPFALFLAHSMHPKHFQPKVKSYSRGTV